MRHSFKTNGKSTWNQRVVSTLWKQTNFGFSFSFEECRVWHWFNVDSMSVCCLG